MMWDKKKALSTILSSRRNSDGSTTSAPMKNEMTMTEDGNEDPRAMAAQDMHRAIAEKSPDMLMQAMSNFIDIHNSMHAKSGAEPDVGPSPKTES